MNTKKHFFLFLTGKDCQALAQVAQVGWGICLLRDVLRSHLDIVMGKKL